MISSQGGDEGDKSDSSKSRIVMRTHEWKFRVTYGALFPTLKERKKKNLFSQLLHPRNNGINFNRIFMALAIYQTH